MGLQKRRLGLGVGRAAIAALVFVLAASWAPAQDNLIHAEILGLHTDQGRVLCALYSSADGFPQKPAQAVAQVSAAISNRSAVCDFPGRPPGTYAISVFHDANSNGKLDTNLLGMPREGVGVSHDAKGHFGPPKFDAAKFQYAGGRLELKITIQYL